MAHQVPLPAWVFVAAYCCLAVILQNAARRAGTRHGWMAWVPVLNLVLLHGPGLRPELREHRARRRWLYPGIWLLDALLIAFVSVFWVTQYCLLCGKSRQAVSLNPLGLASAGLLIRTHEDPTALSEVLEPLWGHDGHVHEWVTCGRTPYGLYLDGQGLEYKQGRFGRPWFHIDMSASEFERVAMRDPELALAAARILLYPYATEREWELRAKPLVDAGLPWRSPSPSALREWRRLCSLRPRTYSEDGLRAGERRL